MEYASEDTPLLRMRGISKSFSGVRVLDDVGFDLHPGEVHVLAGENGAGKSTLMKILAGVHLAYDGEILLHGRRVRFRNPHNASRQGITVIHQEMSLVPSMSVADNIFLGREITPHGYVDRAAQRDKARDVLRAIGLDLHPDDPVDACPVSVRQLIEIAKAVAFDVSILIMDEPTSALNDVEVERLFAIMAELKTKGCGIVYISHRMDEIYKLADRITVLRDGRRVGTDAADAVSRDQLIRWMVGRALTRQFPARRCTAGEVMWRAEEISLAGEPAKGKRTVDRVSFEVRAGEIVGIAGLQGSGKSELLHALFGSFGKRASGRVHVGESARDPTSVQRSMAEGIALLTNDRARSGLVMDMNVVHNATLASLPSFSKGGWIRTRGERKAVRKHAEDLRFDVNALWRPVRTLSGGNQQKVVLSKWLQTRPRLLLLDEPTRGVDVGVKHEIYELMNRWTAEGMSILWVTSEMPELLAMSDRILVMHRGRVTRHFHGAEATQERILAAAMGETVE